MQDQYFKSYEDLEVHRLMLEDEPRTNTYREAICNASNLFKGKVVMDVGAGTGILSLFCAKAGAKKVYAVEASSLAMVLPEIVEANNFSQVIEVIHGKVEEIILDTKVDIIVSEWMGFYLLHESMLESVLYARDKYLVPGGLLFPNRARLYAAPCSLQDLWLKKRSYWTESKYEFDLSPLLLLASQQSAPEIATIPTEGLLSDPQLLWDLDLNTVSQSGLQSFSDRRFFSVESEGPFHGIGLWFTCSFPPAGEGEDPPELSTAPWDEETHWKQTVILLPTEGKLEEGDILGWELNLEKDKDSRAYRIEFNVLDDDEPHGIPCSCGSAKCEIIKHFLNNPNRDSEIPDGNQGGDGDVGEANIAEDNS
ncbi:unnamed protein product [Allacma fusca]|uniref:type I protein arginine methyltransferase n=1 Tax=Allacma fusca TaxID=39272 RepID=A0A8J2PEF7_9HEXA|nr:unnamed protein product [Allacma fusca]